MTGRHEAAAVEAVRRWGRPGNETSELLARACVLYGRAVDLAPDDEETAGRFRRALRELHACPAEPDALHRIRARYLLVRAGGSLWSAEHPGVDAVAWALAKQPGSNVVPIDRRGGG